MQRLFKNCYLLLLIALTYGSKNCHSGKNRCMHTCNNLVTAVSKVIARGVMMCYFQHWENVCSRHCFLILL